LYEKTDQLGPRDIARGGKKGGGPVYDKFGRSDQSQSNEEVVDHQAFNGIKEAQDVTFKVRTHQELDYDTRADDTADNFEERGPNKG